jgi:hypothetical protein
MLRYKYSPPKQLLVAVAKIILAKIILAKIILAKNSPGL